MLGAAIGHTAALRLPHRSRDDLFGRTPACGAGVIFTAAVGEWILNGCTHSAAHYLQKWGRRYPHPDPPYDEEFNMWLWQNDPQPYGAAGAGAAMRVSAVGWAFNTLSDTLNFAHDSAAVTHSHTEGIKSAQAVAAAIFWARTGESKHFIRDNTARLFGYDVAAARRTAGAPAAARAVALFLAGETFEDVLFSALSTAGDVAATATLAAAIAEAYYRGMPPYLRQGILRVLPEDAAAVLLNLPM